MLAKFISELFNVLTAAVTYVLPCLVPCFHPGLLSFLVRWRIFSWENECALHLPPVYRLPNDGFQKIPVKIACVFGFPNFLTKCCREYTTSVMHSRASLRLPSRTYKKANSLDFVQKKPVNTPLFCSQYLHAFCGVCAWYYVMYYTRYAVLRSDAGARSFFRTLVRRQ